MQLLVAPLLAVWYSFVLSFMLLFACVSRCSLYVGLVGYGSLLCQVVRMTPACAINKAAAFILCMCFVIHLYIFMNPCFEGD